MRVLGLLLIAVPFAFGLTRYIATGSDLRYVWMAIVSTLGAAAALVRPGAGASPSGARAGIATVAAAAGAAAMAILLGATAGPGIAIVAVAFGGCSAWGTWLITRARLARSG